MQCSDQFWCINKIQLLLRFFASKKTIEFEPESLQVRRGGIGKAWFGNSNLN